MISTATAAEVARAASRRKAVTISFANVAAMRLAAILDTIAQNNSPNLVVPDAP